MIQSFPPKVILVVLCEYSGGIESICGIELVLPIPSVEIVNFELQECQQVY